MNGNHGKAGIFPGSAEHQLGPGTAEHQLGESRAAAKRVEGELAQATQRAEALADYSTTLARLALAVGTVR